jgi:thermitase
MKKSLSVGLLALSVLTTAQAHQKTQMAEHVPGQLLVKFTANGLKAFMDRKQSDDIKIQEVANLLMGDVALIEIGKTKSLQTMIYDLQNDPAIEYAEPNYIYRAIKTYETLESKLYKANYREEEYLTSAPNDARFRDLWGLHNTGNNEPASSRGNSAPRGIAGADVNAFNAWSITKGDKKVKIAVIDTGVDYNHPDLKNNMWVNIKELNGKPGVDDDGNGFIDDVYGYDFANNDGDPMDGNGHGTHCAGTIAAEHDNRIGVAGVMAHASIIGIKFLTDQGSGSSLDAIKSIDYATKLNVDIMSNSWGGGGYSQALKDAIVAAKNKGIIFTAAAGNSATDNNNTPHYPSNYDVENVISVAAHNYNDQLATFSCYGSRTVHVAAPGVNVLSTTPNNGYDVYSGTSMATPHVTGVIGLYIAEFGRKDVKLIRDELMSSSIYSKAYGKKTIGKGRVDAYNFLTGVVASRPVEPNPNDWLILSESYETAHPYPNNAKISKKFRVSGAKFVRLTLSRYELEDNYDFAIIRDGQGVESDKISGSGSQYQTEYVEGDTIEIELSSDSSINKWGFHVSEVQYIQ